MILRKYTLMFLSILILSTSYAQADIGEIVFLKSGTYQIDYPNQVINVYFTVMPSGIFEHLVTGLSLTEDERYNIVVRLRNQIDKLPEDFIGKFLSVDIHPLHIRNEITFGYYYENQIVVEIEKMKLSSASDGGIEANFLHELAHRIYDRMKRRDETISLISYFERFQARYPCYHYSSNIELFKSGYVSKYAAGKLTDSYDSEEEFAELFAYLIWEQSRNDLFNYVSSFPQSIIASKANKYIDYLEKIVPSINKEYLLSNSSAPLFASSSTPDEEFNLLDVHGYKSNESYDFDNYNVDEEMLFDGIDTAEEIVIDESEDTTEDADAIDAEATEESSSYDYIDYSALDYTSAFTPASSSYEKAENKSKRKKEKKEKRKKHKGESWGMAILALAIGVAAEFLL